MATSKKSNELPDDFINEVQALIKKHKLKNTALDAIKFKINNASECPDGYEKVCFTYANGKTICRCVKRR